MATFEFRLESRSRFFFPLVIHADPASDRAFFENKIRPLLVTHCYECHSAQSKKIEGGLRLDSRLGWQKGGESGPAIVPGQTEESRLIKAIRYDDSDLQMPPDGKLSAADIASLTQWIKMGAPDPRDTEAPVAKDKKIDVEKGKQYWAFSAPHSPCTAGCPESFLVAIPGRFVH